MQNNNLNNDLQLIEIVVPGVATTGNTSTRIQIQDQPYLHNTNIWSLEAFNIGDVPKTLQNNDVITLPQMKSAFLTLYCNDVSPGAPKGTKGEYIQQIPLVRMHNAQNSATDAFERRSFDLVGQQIQWDKCYINLAAPFNNVTNVSFLLLVNFTFINQ